LKQARTQVKDLLSEKLDQLHAVAAALLDHETLTAAQIKVCTSVCQRLAMEPQLVRSIPINGSSSIAVLMILMDKLQDMTWCHS
jgi:prophage DNA circulation protein